MRWSPSTRDNVGQGLPTPILTACFALLAAAGTGEIWVHRFAAADTGMDYWTGRTTLAAGLLLAVLCIIRGFGWVGASRYYLVAFSLAGVMLAMPMWLYADVIGRPDPALLKPELSRFVVSWATLEGGTGIWMSAAGAACCLVTLCWQLVATVRSRQPSVPVSITSFAAVAALFAAFGAISPWASGFRWSELGVEHMAGLVTLAAAAIAVIVCALYADGQIRLRSYAGLGLVTGIIMLGAPLSFWAGTIGNADPYFEDLLILCADDPCGRIHSAIGLHISTTAALVFVSVLAVDLVDRFARAARERTAVAQVSSHRA